ncbi:MAG TPA: HEAT repeat domain-containing protein [Vicinamibacterales bacterium]|nr:HEAT repeat domain-containing protein [Vicinamibacterales bacterium]
MAAIDPAEALSPDDASRLAEFARACKAAVRVVALYPATHPAIQTSLSRVAESAERLRSQGAAVLTVLPDAVLLDGRSAVKPDSALGELAALLHLHLIGELRVTGEVSHTAWHAFLMLLSRSAEDIRGEGGIERVWMSSGGGPIEIRQIDYNEVLRERAGGLDGGWDRIVANYLEGEFSNLNDEAMTALLDIAGETNRFKDFTEQLVSKAAESNAAGNKEVVLRILQALADFVATHHPEQLDRILTQVSGVLPRLTPDLVVTLITTGAPKEGGPPGIDLPGEVRARLSDQTVAEFVAQSVSREQGATGRLAQAFQALVADESKRSELLEMAEREAANLPIGRQPEFPHLWKSAADLLTTYSDSKFVSDEYGRELATARAHAIEVERVSDDPPERVSAWLATVSEAAIRQHDHQVLLDLLALETRPDAWTHVLESAIRSIHQHVLTGDLALAQPVLDAILGAAEDGQPFADTARSGLERLRSGPLTRHVVLFIRQAQDSEVQAISAFCRALGPSVIGPLAEALASEQGAAVKRLRDVLLSFGAAGRGYADELRSSANPAVRRTAVELLRAFGGADALPDLARLLDDAEPAVQREALRAIVQIGTAEAYATLQEALKSGNTRTRDVIMQVLVATRDDRAAPLFVYILEHSDHRGRLESVCLSAIDALGKLGGDPESVKALKNVLYRGEWWAPRRTNRLRSAAALALRAAGSDAAQRALEDAASDGRRGVRRAARTALSAPAPRIQRRTG